MAWRSKYAETLRTIAKEGVAALHGGAIGLLKDGDLLRVDAVNGCLDCLTDLSGRTQAEIDLTLEQEGWGRELFSVMRRAVSSAECGATIFD